MELLPKVTFVMPAYNVEKYIRTAIESVIAQTEENWEMIIVDDCSSDRTLHIAEDFAMQDPRIRVIRRHKQSGGAFTPRKEAILKATTEFISPLDADDYIEPTYLSSLLETLLKTESDVVYPVMFNWDGRTLELRNPVDRELLGNTIKGRDAVKYTLDGWRIHCNGGLIRRSVYLKSFEMFNDKDVNIQSFIDEYLTRLILFNSNLVSVTGVKYYYRDNSESITHVKDIRAFGFLENDLRLITMIKAFYPENSEEFLLVQRHNFHCIFDTWRLLRTAELTEEEKEIVERSLVISRNEVDFKLLKENVSKKYMWLLRLPESMARSMLAFMDYLKGRE